MKNVCLAEAIDNAHISSSLPVGGTVNIHVDVMGAMSSSNSILRRWSKELGRCVYVGEASLSAPAPAPVALEI